MYCTVETEAIRDAVYCKIVLCVLYCVDRRLEEVEGWKRCCVLEVVVSVLYRVDRELEEMLCSVSIAVCTVPCRQRARGGTVCWS